MPPPLPERYDLEVRVGRDEDIELWLATDTSLDRPVEIRFLGPDSSLHRRARFLASVRDAAAVSHPHFTSVYTAGEVPDGVYAVSEWTGAVSFRDRLASGETVEPEEFLANAAGVAEALAALHEAGIVHGAIDTGCLFHAVSHPAKLGGVDDVGFWPNSTDEWQTSVMDNIESAREQNCEDTTLLTAALTKANNDIKQSFSMFSNLLAKMHENAMIPINNLR